eukprot:1161041-Pelagomonas_calceolata.AAC.2
MASWSSGTVTADLPGFDVPAFNQFVKMTRRVAPANAVAGTEVVSEDYKGLPLWRTAAWLLLHFSVSAVI